MQHTLLFISGGEILIILIIIVVLFGSKRLPEIARGVGKGIQEFKKAADDIKREIREENIDVVKDVKKFKEEIKNETNKFKTFETEDD